MRAATTVTFESLEIGQVVPVVTKQVTLAQIRAYAEASGDRNPIHLDERFARSVGLPGVIAHGMLTMAFASQMLTDWLGDRSRLKRLYGRFAGMVVPGDELTCSGAIVKKDEAARLIVINLAVTNPRGEKVMTKGVAEAEFPNAKE